MRSHDPACLTLPDMSINQPCHRCAGELSSETAVPLWDGNLYCEQCVESQMPGLANYAREHSQLEESPSKESLRSWRGLLVLSAFLFLFFGGLFVLTSYQTQGLSGIISGIVFALFLIGITSVLQGTGIAWMARNGSPTVIVRQGRVAVLRPGYKHMSGRWAKCNGVSETPERTPC